MFEAGGPLPTTPAFSEGSCTDCTQTTPLPTRPATSNSLPLAHSPQQLTRPHAPHVPDTPATGRAQSLGSRTPASPGARELASAGGPDYQSPQSHSGTRGSKPTDLKTDGAASFVSWRKTPKCACKRRRPKCLVRWPSPRKAQSSLRRTCWLRLVIHQRAVLNPGGHSVALARLP